MNFEINRKMKVSVAMARVFSVMLSIGAAIKAAVVAVGPIAVFAVISLLVLPVSAHAQIGNTANTWYVRASAPAALSDGGALVYPGSGDNIYALRGNGTQDFWSFSISNNSWTTAPANFPTGNVGGGGSLVYPGSGDTIYAFQGGSNTIFRAYSISNDSWYVRANTPDNVSNGGSLVYPGSGDTLYALRGGGNQDFWAYSISNDTWIAMTSAPGGVAAGGSLVYPGSGDTIYAFRGGGTVESITLWAYSISNNTWDTMANAPGNVRARETITPAYKSS